MARDYEPMTSLDHAFLALEGPTTYMHVAATAVLDAGPLSTPQGGIDLSLIRRYVASRMAAMPRYRQRLAWVPIENRPVWIDDDHFDIEFHIRHCSLPRPGTTAQLQELCARLLEQPLDRRRPLWEIWVIEGLAGGRFALHMKVHHCMVDGIAGVDLMANLFQLTSDATVGPIEPWTPRPAPSERRLLRDEMRRRLSLSTAALSGLRSWISGPRETQEQVRVRMNSVWDLLRTGMTRPAETPINQTISSHRRVRWMTLDLDEVKDTKNTLGGTVNDVVLTTVAGGLDRYLETRGFRPTKELRLGVPVNVHHAGGGRGMGNHVWAWLVPLDPNLRGPIRRYRALQEATGHLKRSQQALGGEVVTGAFDWTTANLLPLGAKLLHRLQPYNLMVTNVPGPPVPLYLLGSRIEELYPWVPLFENQGLGIALFSYDGKLWWSIGADWDLVPDVDVFVDALAESFRELRRAAARSATVRSRQLAMGRRSEVAAEPARSRDARFDSAS